MIKKASSNWHMYTEFLDLKKSCPKDSYSLSNIDCLVDGASRCETLSFMDDYFEKKNISMHPVTSLILPIYNVIKVKQAISNYK